MKHARIPILVLLVAAFTSIAAGTQQQTTAKPAKRASPITAGGTASGAWDLPVPSQGTDGFASGVLHLGGSFPFYLMTAVLPAAGVEGSGVGSSGNLYGTLHSFPLSPIGKPWAQVTGTWTATDASGGTFTAIIHSGGGPLGLQTIPLGLIAGTFTDHVVPGGPAVLGSFDADWSLDLLH